MKRAARTLHFDRPLPTNHRKMIMPKRSLAILLLTISTPVAAAVEVTNEGECSADSIADGSCNAKSNDEDSSFEFGAGSVPDEMNYNPACEDKDERCGGWANIGECDANPDYMLIHCAVACNSCPDQIEFSDEEKELLDAVAKYGKTQTVQGEDAAKTMEVVRKTVHYMQNDIYGENPTVELTPSVLAECTNREELCAFWVAIGECEANKAYMKTKCAPSCQTCDMIDINARCPPLSDDVRPALLPGELNMMFERIVATAPGNQTDENFVIPEGLTNYTVHVHSRPKPLEEGEERISKKRDLEQPPWIITFENLLTEEECKYLIEMGRKSNYERSEDVGKLLADGSYDSVQSQSRTSKNAWCSYRNKCRDDPQVELMHNRLEKITGIPTNHSEDFQVLKYEHGQFYRQHHDYIGHQRDRRSGPRMLTFFLYLSDVEEGGATNFPDLGIAVYPKMGKAVLWPSVLDSNPFDKEPRTDHEAQDVIKGQKYGANSWIHSHDYMAAQELGCT